MHVFGPICSQCLLTRRYCLRRHPGASTAVTGTAGGWCHPVVQAENARVSPGFRYLKFKLSHFSSVPHTYAA